MQNSNNSMVKPKVKNSLDIFQESFIHVKRDTLQINDHPPYPYYVLKTSPFAVIILASTKENEFLFIHEYRHPTGKFILSCPAGYIETSEDPLCAAERELLEETGYQGESFKVIGSAYPYAGITGQKNIFVKAFHVSYLQPPRLERSEIIQPVLVSKNELFNRIRNGAELDANLLAALSFNALEKCIGLDT